MGADPKNNEPVTIDRATKEFLADIEARKMDDSTRRKYCTMLKQLRAYATECGFLYLNQFSVEELTKFRGTWKDGLRSAAKKLERVRGFFRFAHEREWIAKNPAAKLKPPVGSSKPANKHRSQTKKSRSCSRPAVSIRAVDEATASPKEK